MRPTLFVAALLSAGTLAAQATPTTQPSAAAERAAQAAVGVVDSALMRALDLPRVMQRAREAGVPDSSIRGILDAMRRRRVPAGEASPAVELEVEAVERGAPKDNFGSFVRGQVERGLRGRDLAAAIHAERARRGMGPASRGGRPEADARGNRPAGAGRPNAAAGPQRGGRPDSAARPSVRPGRPQGGNRPVPDSADKAPTRGKRP